MGSMAGDAKIIYLLVGTFFTTFCEKKHCCFFLILLLQLMLFSLAYTYGSFSLVSQLQGERECASWR